MKKKMSPMDEEAMMFAANAIIGTRLGQAAMEGARRVAMNGAPAERELFAASIAKGEDLPDSILNYINAIEKSLEAAKAAGVLATEWLEDLELHVSCSFALHLGGDVEVDPGYTPPLYMAPLDAALKEWAEVGIKARPKIIEGMKEFAQEAAQSRGRKFEAMLN